MGVYFQVGRMVKFLASGGNSSHPPSSENPWVKLYVKFHVKPVAWRQVNRLRVEETMYVALSLFLYLWDLEEQWGKGFKVIIWMEGEKLQRGEFLWGGRGNKNLPRELTLPRKLTLRLVYLNYLPLSAFFDVKRYMHYIRFYLIKTSQALGILGKIKV